MAICLDTHARDFEKLESKEVYNYDFRIHELEKVLRDVKVSAASGADNLPPWFHAHCGNNACACISKTLNDSFGFGMLPTQHKDTDLVHIPKPRRDRTLIKSYIPVRLTFVNARVLNKRVKTL